MFKRKVGSFYDGWNHDNLKRRRNGLSYHRNKHKHIAEKRLIEATRDIWYKKIMKEEYNRVKY